MTTVTTQAIIDELELIPHPEGGYYRELYRDGTTDEQGALTTIYFMLLANQPSRWHRVLSSAEVWCFHAGSPLMLRLSNDMGRGSREVVLGANVLLGERPQYVVRPNEWQMAETCGEWTLVSCVVAPAFLFSHFEMVDSLPSE